MKKILGLALVSALGVSMVSATEHIKDLIHFAEAVKGKSITIPAAHVKEWHTLAARSARLHAAHFRHVADSLPEMRIVTRAAYFHVAKELDNLANDIQALPAISYTKTFSHPGLMLALKAAKGKLVGDKLKFIGEKLNDKQIVAFGEKMAQWGNELHQELKSMVCPGENPTNEGQEEWTENEGGEDMAMGHVDKTTMKGRGMDRSTMDMNEGSDDMDMEEGNDMYEEEGEEASSPESTEPDADEEDNETSEE